MADQEECKRKTTEQQTHQQFRTKRVQEVVLRVRMEMPGQENETNKEKTNKCRKLFKQFGKSEILF